MIYISKSIKEINVFVTIQLDYLHKITKNPDSAGFCDYSADLLLGSHKKYDFAIFL